MAKGFLIRCFWIVVAGLSGSAVVLSFVPSCEKQLAMAYPPALKSDLSACAVGNNDLQTGEPVNLAKFSSRLTGTWELSSRTVEGVTTDFRTGYTMLYFDLPPDNGEQRRGAALLIDRAPEFTNRGPLVAGFWKVALTRTSKALVSLETERAAGSRISHSYDFAPGSFFEYRNVFVRQAAAKPGSEDNGQRIVVMENVMTRISCDAGIVERYQKTSAAKPVIDGRSIADSWEAIQENRRVASLSPATSEAFR
jgi:hypothetical protein